MCSWYTDRNCFHLPGVHISHLILSICPLKGIKHQAGFRPCWMSFTRYPTYVFVELLYYHSRKVMRERRDVRWPEATNHCEGMTECLGSSMGGWPDRCHKRKRPDSQQSLKKQSCQRFWASSAEIVRLNYGWLHSREGPLTLKIYSLP